MSRSRAPKPPSPVYLSRPPYFAAKHCNLPPDQRENVPIFSLMERFLRTDGRESEHSRPHCSNRISFGFGGVIFKRGRLCEKPPLKSRSFGPFLGDARKGHTSPFFTTMKTDSLRSPYRPFGPPLFRIFRP